MNVDRVTCYMACGVGMLCTVAGLQQALHGHLAASWAFILLGFVIGLFVWMHLIAVWRSRR